MLSWMACLAYAGCHAMAACEACIAEEAGYHSLMMLSLYRLNQIFIEMIEQGATSRQQQGWHSLNHSLLSASQANGYQECCVCC